MQVLIFLKVAVGFQGHLAFDCNDCYESDHVLFQNPAAHTSVLPAAQTCFKCEILLFTCVLSVSPLLQTADPVDREGTPSCSQ